MALGFMFKHRLIWFFVFPILLNLILWVGGFNLVGQFSDYLLNYTNEVLKNMDWGMDKDGWIFTVVYAIVWLSLRVLYFLLFAYLGGYLILILLSPVLTLLSQKTEEKLNGACYPFSMLQFLNDIMRSVAVTLRNFSMELVLIIVLLAFSLIPPLGLILPFVLFFISAYFYGFSLVDYTLERRGIGVSKSIKFIRNHSGSAMSLGTPMALVLLIPFLGSMLAGFIAIVSVVAATLESVELLDQNKLKKN